MYARYSVRHCVNPLQGGQDAKRGRIIYGKKSGTAGISSLSLKDKETRTFFTICGHLKRRGTMKLTGSQIVMETLLEHGVNTVFGYPGGCALNVYDELYKYSDKINHVLAAHEQGASFAADGYARATGGVGVVIATSGPGATNLVTGIANAFMDSIPMVAVTVNVPNSLIGRDSFQEIYITGITMPITKHNFFVRTVEDLAPAMRDAFRIAKSGRPGPVLVDIAKDVTIAMGEYEAAKPAKLTVYSQIDKNEVKAVAELLNNCERPVIFFGGGIIASGASEKLRTLLEKTQIPTSHSVMGTGVLSYGDTLNMGMIGMHGSVTSGMAVKKADLVVALGTRFSDRVATNINKFTDAKIVQVDIDAAEINKNIRIEHGIVADVGEVIDMLIPLVEKRDHKEWLSTIASWRHEYDNNLEYPEDRLRPWHVMKIISDSMPEDTMIATDVGQHQMWAAQYCSKVSPRSFLTSGGLGAMGYGMGAAIGASMGRPGAPVVLVTGDGCFHMNCNEMATAVSNNIPLVVVLLNNGTLGMVRQWQTLFYGQRYSATNTGVRQTNFTALAEAFGAKGYLCNTPAEFEKAIKESFDAKSPCLIECTIDKDEKVLPFIPAGRSFDDVILAENIGN